ncbi:MAG: S-layer protein [Candidatus Diapherotrites archaeon]
MSYVVTEEKGKKFKVNSHIVRSVGEIKPLLNEQAWKIYRTIAENPSYPAQIAKKVNLGEQKVYYYIGQMKKAGLVEVNKTEEVQGGLAKFYSAKYDAFSLIANIDKGKDVFDFSDSEKETSQDVADFLHPFIHNKEFSAQIAIGSPDPHGQYKARARDGHLAVELAAFFGVFSKSFKYPIITLDTNVPSLETFDSNLIIVGGPVTNKLTDELNQHLDLRFEPSGGHWVIKSEISGKEYVEDSTGIIEKIHHPYFKDKSILVIAGKRNAGTKAAIVALFKHLDDIIKPNLFDGTKTAKVVEGLDLDGDGIIDDVEVKE